MEFGILNAVQSTIILLLDLYVLIKAFKGRKNGVKNHFFSIMAISASVEQLMSLLVRVIKTKLVSCDIVHQYCIYILMFITMVLTACFCMRYLLYLKNGKKKLSVLYFVIMAIPCVVMIVTALLSPWTHWLFWLDSSVNYHRGSLFILQLLCPYSFALVATVLMIIMLIRPKDEKEKNAIRYFLCFIVPVLLGGMLQVVLNVDGGYSSIGVSISVVLLYMEFYVEEIKEIEHLKDVQAANISLENRIKTIQTLGKVYFTSFYINIPEDTFFEVTNIETMRQYIGVEGKATTAINTLCEKLVKKEFTQKMHVFMDMQTMDERLGNRKYITEKYIGSVSNIWCQAYIIEGERDENGKLKTFLFATRIIQDEQALEEEQNKILKDAKEQIEQVNSQLENELKIAEEAKADALLNNEIISSISKLYFAIFRIDLVQDFYEEVASDNEVHRLTGHSGAAYQRMMELCDSFVTAEYDSEIREFFNLHTLADRLSDTETITAEYLATDGNWHQARFIAKRRDEKGRVTNVLYVTRLVSREKIKELETARMLQVANNAKTTFLFNMSHDIRTPMNAIIGYCDLMYRDFEDKEKCRDYLQKVRSSSDFLLSLINNILEMARIESGKAVLDESPCCSSDIVEKLNSVYSELMRDKQINFTVTENITSPYIYCDKVKVNEIFLNLLSNAYRYTSAGGSITMDVTELPSDQEGFVLMQATISDTGIGMSKDYLPHIFDEFSREYSSTDNKIQGTGLGMPIVKKLVELMKGTITVESELGKGTTFVVTLPHRIADESEIKGKGSAEINEKTFEGMRILLAEDNDFNAEIATEMLEDSGFIVERAADGIICVDMLSKSEENYYDFILMDIQMPNMDGYKAAQTIREMSDDYRKNIPIIAMTANAFENDKKNAFEAGMNGHIAKPVKANKVLEVISEVLQRK